MLHREDYIPLLGFARDSEDFVYRYSDTIIYPAKTNFFQDKNSDFQIHFSSGFRTYSIQTHYNMYIITFESQSSSAWELWPKLSRSEGEASKHVPSSGTYMYRLG